MNILRQARRAFPPRRGATRRRKVSRGQALIEFGLLFFPLMMTMVILSTDTSTLLDNHLNVVYAARAGARVGSVIGDYAPSAAPYTADCAIIGAVESALVGSREVQIVQIAIYDSNAQGQVASSSGVSPLPPNGTPLEDVYSGATTCASGIPTPAATQTDWPPAIRSNKPFSEDSIGVAITYTYTFQFNPLGGGTFQATDDAVMPIEIVIGTQPTATPTP